jgi:two-component system LytT family response regulator
MIVHKAIVVKEELINVSELTKLISNYCLTRESVIEAIPIESLILEINIVNPDVIFVDVKPLIMEQVINAVTKVVNTMELNKFIENSDTPAVIIQNLNIECREYVAISSVDEIFFIKMENIMYCKSEGRFTKFFLENGDVSISSRNIGDYDHRVLDPSNFFRIHNSYIINMKYIKRIIKTDGNSCEMKNGHVIAISKRRQDDFNKFIKLKM